MKRTTIVRPYQNGDIRHSYDAFIGAVGYETRARYIASQVELRADTLFACAFDDRKVFSYEINRLWFEGHGFAVEEIPDSRFHDWCQEVIKAILSKGDLEVKIGIDVSSMSRFKIAAWVSTLLEHDGEQIINTDFLYAPAQFSQPSGSEGPIIVSKPVTEKFAGWSTEPSHPPVTIFGLGYERDKAVGVMEYIEPGEVWAFRPAGDDARYEKALVQANTAFWDLPQNHVLEYRVDRPYECYNNLESLVYGTLRTARPILVPFGPKIFAVICLLVACVHYPEISVWRVSSGQFEPPLDRVPAGPIIGINAEFNPTISDASLSEWLDGEVLSL